MFERAWAGFEKYAPLFGIHPAPLNFLEAYDQWVILSGPPVNRWR